ncbi:PAS-domain containing protein [Ruegeria jejuensis]|uniref:PAS-domain containing protein n=1 Tax=Ruegeria jejuensis TaxID=3233338 RepID=UPI00355AFA34
MAAGDWITLTSICVLSAILAALWISPRRALAGPAGHLLRFNPRRKTVYLFDGEDLIGMSDNGPGLQDSVVDWDTLHAHLSVDFPGFPDSPEKVRWHGEIRVPPIDGSNQTEVFCEWIDGVTRVELRAARPDTACDETAPMRLAMDKAPYPAWYLDGSNRVTWCNTAYSMLARKVRDNRPRLEDPFFPDPQALGALDRKKRISIETEDGQHKLWYDFTALKQQGGFLCYAVDAHAVVEAEVARRDFVQTLSKTFAQLSTGLAIFDRNQQLALFNPALTDLTALPIDFLSARPSIASFFDRLRNNNMMPEPKSYSSWRHQIDALLQAAADGRYQETWSLPCGSVYSVSGRPHPDGAVAFLFEDITAEITLTRRFRADMELGQTILDHLDDAIAVFSADGALSYCNRAFRTLWEVDPDESFDQISVLDATRIWQERCTATPVWGDIRDFVAARENRSDWWAQVQLRKGHPLAVSVSPLPNMATMVSFNHESAPADVQNKRLTRA